MSRTVLIADDHADTVEMAKGFLELHGYDVVVAYDGREALRVAEERKPFSILLDIALPELDGFAVATALRQSETFSDAIVIAYSGHGGEQFYERARNSGIDYYLLKPSDPSVLVACLEPEQYPDILAVSVVVIKSRDLKKASTDLLALGQALSVRSEAAVRRAQQICQRTLQRNSRRQKAE